MFPGSIIGLISKVSPFLGMALGSPVVAPLVGNLVSNALGGVDMHDTESMASALDKPGAIDKLKELELQLNDIQNARLSSEKDLGLVRLIRPMLALLAMCALVADVYAIQLVTDKMLNEILIMMLIFLVWDIRQIYKFYFGSSDDLPKFPVSFKK